VRRPLVVTVLVLATAAVVAGVAQSLQGGSADSSARTITVVGVGSVDTVPDRASYAFSVDSRAKTAAAAYAANGPASQKLVDAVHGAGVARPDIQTTATTLSAQTSDDGQSIVGYVASTTISALIRDLGDAGKVLDAAVGAGATAVNGPTLTSSKQDDLYEAALARAVDQAQGKAATLAKAAKLTLGDVQSIVEGGSSATPLPSDAKAGAPALEPGTTTVDASVTVTYGVS
jgi:hypothetical protein